MSLCCPVGWALPMGCCMGCMSIAVWVAHRLGLPCGAHLQDLEGEEHQDISRMPGCSSGATEEECDAEGVEG